MSPKKAADTTRRSDDSSATLENGDTEAEKQRSEALLKDLKPLVKRAEKGDKKALPKLREALEEVPNLARTYIDPAVQAERNLINNYAGENLLVKEALPRTLKAMRDELGGDNPSPLEQLLVERVVATWLQVQYFESLYTQNIKELTRAQGEYHQSLIDRAHKRHLSAVRTLAQLRKVLKPSVAQINIAEQQINMAGGESSGIPGRS